MEYIPAKTIVTRRKRPEAWFGIDYNMNIYVGCCHDCIYCDSRSACYHIEDFERVRAKRHALEIIRFELHRWNNRTGVVGSGSMSDPYNPYERRLGLTRNSLELLNTYGYGTALLTKSPLITRDIDVLMDIRKQSPVLCMITITCADDGLSQILEPNVALSSERFEALGELADAGLDTCLMLTPVLPFITDREKNIVDIVDMAHRYGVKYIYPGFGVTLRNNQREYFYQQLDRELPGMKERYIHQFGNRYHCISPDAQQLWDSFRERCDSYGILYETEDIIHDYQQPYYCEQLRLVGI